MLIILAQILSECVSFLSSLSQKNIVEQITSDFAWEKW